MKYQLAVHKETTYMEKLAVRGVAGSGSCDRDFIKLRVAPCKENSCLLFGLVSGKLISSMVLVVTMFSTYNRVPLYAETFCD